MIKKNSITSKDKSTSVDSNANLSKSKVKCIKRVEYSEKIISEILERIAEGESLRQICTTDNLPSRETIRSWLKEDKNGLAARYARAREEQADFYADEIIAIADACDDPQKARVQIDARKWIACKLKPTTYGDKIDLKSSDGSMSPLKQISVVFVDKVDDAETD